MTEHEREVAREVEHERSPTQEGPGTSSAAEPTSEHEREVAREVEGEQPPDERGPNVNVGGIMDVQPDATASERDDDDGTD